MNPGLKDIWRDCNLSGQLHIGNAYEPLPFADGSVTLVTSNSVWSHLSESLARHSLAEVRRILQPGGLVFLTTYDMRHLLRWEKEQSRRRQAQYRRTDTYPVSISDAIEAYKAGEFVFIPTGSKRSLVDYENAAIPRAWFERGVPGYDLVAFTDQVLPQSLACLRAV